MSVAPLFHLFVPATSPLFDILPGVTDIYPSLSSTVLYYVRNRKQELGYVNDYDYHIISNRSVHYIKIEIGRQSKIYHDILYELITTQAINTQLTERPPQVDSLNMRNPFFTIDTVIFFHMKTILIISFGEMFHAF